METKRDCIKEMPFQKIFFKKALKISLGEIHNAKLRLSFELSKFWSRKMNFLSKYGRNPKKMVENFLFSGILVFFRDIGCNYRKLSEIPKQTRPSPHVSQ